MERNENKTVPAKYYSMEEVTVKGFCDFCRNNIPLVIAVSITLVFTYGIRLFWYSIGIDTERFMIYKSDLLLGHISQLRFGLALLSKLWYIKEFNPFTAFFTAFCLIWFFTISWCYIISVFSRDTGRNNKLIPFALVFVTLPVWAEMFYYLFASAECALIVSLCPYIIYLSFKGFLDNEKGKVICAFILLVFIVSVYQAIVPMFCCGVFICFLLLQENSEYEPQVYRNLCLKLFITLLGSLMVYLFIARIIFSVSRVEEELGYGSGYVDDMNQWGKGSIRHNVFRILSIGYNLTIGNIPMFQNIVNPIIVGNSEMYFRPSEVAVEEINNLSRVYGNILLLPSVVFFLFKLTLVMRGKIPSGRRLLYILAGIGIPLSIMLLPIVCGTRVPTHALWALPLAFAFVLFYLIRTCKKKAAAIIACLSLAIALHQAEIGAQLFYSDQVRYNEDVRFAYELDNLITKVQPENEKLPFVIIGRYQIVSRFQMNFIKAQYIGHSFFDAYLSPPNNVNVAERTSRVLCLMKTLGINYDMPDGNQIERAIKEAASMPNYPDPGSVKRMQDYIVVKLSENLFEF